jgi:hypothetical protein
MEVFVPESTGRRPASRCRWYSVAVQLLAMLCFSDRVFYAFLVYMRPGEKQNTPVFRAFNVVLLVLSGSLFVCYCVAMSESSDVGEVSGWAHFLCALFLDFSR